MKIKNYFKRNGFLLLLIFVSSFLSFFGLMPNIVHPDEPHLFEKSRDLILNIFSRGDFNPHTFKYGTINFYFHALIYFPFLVGEYCLYYLNLLLSTSSVNLILPFEEFFVGIVKKQSILIFSLGRALTAGFGVGGVFLTYLIGKKLFDKNVGLLAGFLLSISPLYVRDSHYITTDVPFTFFILLSFYFLLLLIETDKLKHFFWAGFFTGISIAVRYFPIGAIAYPVTILVFFKRKTSFFIKSFSGGVAIILGFFIGVPWLFLEKEGFNHFMKDMQEYVFPWYSTSISVYIFSFLTSIISGLPLSTLDISTIVPDKFNPFFLRYIVFHGFGILPFGLALVGTLFIFFRYPKKAIVFLSIPVLTFVYTSFYIRANYERLVIPILPFLAISSGVALSLFMNHYKRKIIFFIILFLIIAQPLWVSYRISYSCSQDNINTLSQKFVEKNVPTDATIAHLPTVSMPGDPRFGKLKFIEMFPEGPMSLEEVATKGAKYAFIDTGRLEYNNYLFFNSFLITPEKMYKNSYLYLTLAEYFSRSELIGEATKERMCESHRIYYFKLPLAKNNLFKEKLINSFADIDPLTFRIDSYASTGKTSFILDKTAKLLRFSSSNYGLTSPRLFLDQISVEKKYKYKISLRLKTADKDKSEHQFIVRGDFYATDKSKLSMYTKIRQNLNKFFSFVRNGISPKYYEDERRITSNYFDDSYPGGEVYLSQRIAVSDKWQNLSLIVEGPENYDKLIFSLQSDSSDEGNQFDIYVDKLRIVKLE